jgi:glycosyltransferase involved in cell wall biosynthesis
MRITFIISSLSHGGAERVMSIMANYWAAKGWKITLLTFDDGKTPPFYDLEPSIKHIPLGIAGDSLVPFTWGKMLIQNKILKSFKLTGLFNSMRRIQVLRSAISKSNPDAVISFIETTNILTIIAARSLNIPIVVSERSNPSMHSIGKTWNLLRRITYPYADRVVVQTKQVCSYFSSRLQKKLTVIPNPVIPVKTNNKTESSFVHNVMNNNNSVIPRLDRGIQKTLDCPVKPDNDKHYNPPDAVYGKPMIVAMGRLGQEKGFDILLQAFARLKDHFPEWTLTILGEGPLRNELENLKEQLDLNDRVHMPGIIKNPQEILQQADLFVLSSRYEGFPNALCEAMACGTAVIATDCPYGVREIVQGGVNGILIPSEDVYALTASMEQLMSDEAKRRQLGSHAKEITEWFHIEKVMGMWEEVLHHVCSIGLKVS